MNRRLDDDLERLLADDGGELGKLYRRLPRPEPPRRLDRNVLAEAARAIHGRRPRKQRWLIGVGSAAGFVLAAGVAWHIGREAVHAPAPAANYSAPSYVPVHPLETPARQRASTPAADTTSAEAPISEVSRQAAPPAKPAARPPSPSAAPAAAAPKPMASPALAPPPPAAEPETIESSAQAVPEASTQNESGVAASSRATRVAGDAQPATPKAEAAEQKSVGRRAAGAPTPSSSAELRRDTQLAPEVWLARIQQLLHQGRRQQALESLRLFRRMHPDWQLPEELRALDP